MRLADEQYEEIKQTVIDTFITYDVKCIPINGFELATKMGITIVPYSSLSKKKREVAEKFSMDGFSLETSKKWTIYYNDNCRNYGRINQTIMHEIGHYVLGHTDDGLVEESEAKFFAKYALAPPPLIHTMQEPITQITISKVFDISLEAAGYAYTYYNQWLKHSYEYTEYEKMLIRLFAVA